MFKRRYRKHLNASFINRGSTVELLMYQDIKLNLLQSHPSTEGGVEYLKTENLSSFFYFSNFDRVV